MIHQLEIESRHFIAKGKGHKSWEFRLNDRNFKVGDYIGLNEIDKDGSYTGRFIIEKIVDITYPEELPDGCIDKDYVILSTEACELWLMSEQMNAADLGVVIYGNKKGEEADEADEGLF